MIGQVLGQPATQLRSGEKFLFAKIRRLFVPEVRPGVELDKIIRPGPLFAPRCYVPIMIKLSSLVMSV